MKGHLAPKELLQRALKPLVTTLENNLKALSELLFQQAEIIFLKPRSKFFFRRSNLAAFEQPLSKLKL